MIVTVILTENSPVAAMWKDRNRRAGTLHGTHFSLQGGRFVADTSDLSDAAVDRLSADPFVDVIISAVPLSPLDGEDDDAGEANEPDESDESADVIVAPPSRPRGRPPGAKNRN